MRHLHSRHGLRVLVAVCLLFAAYAGGKLLAQTAFGTIERVTLTSSGGQTNDHSGWPFLSADGRFVAFSSPATNIVPGDTNGFHDVFVRDRVAGTVERVSITSAGGQFRRDCIGSSISADGRYVVFLAQRNIVGDVFVRDRVSRTTTRVNLDAAGGEPEVGAAGRPQISADGRFVAFRSEAGDLVSGDLNGIADIFVRDLQTGLTERVSVNSGEEEGIGDAGRLFNGDWDVSISATGRFVVFRHTATNLVPDDLNEIDDLFLRDRLLGTTERVSVYADGGQLFAPHPCCWSAAEGRTAVSTDGRFVAFSSALPVTPDDTNDQRSVFVRDRRDGVTMMVSPWLAPAVEPDMSADARLVTYSSTGDSWGAHRHVYLYDRLHGTTTQVTTTNSGGDPDGPTYDHALSDDGRVIAFGSFATNFVPGDTNGLLDIFVREIRGAVGPPDLTLMKSVSTPTVQAGATVTYTLDIENIGAGAADEVVIEDRLPVHTTFLSCAAPAGGTCSGSGRTRTIALPSLAAGASATASLAARVSCAVPDGTTLTNGASVRTTSEESSVANNSAEAAVRAINPPPTISGLRVDKPVLWPPNNQMVDVAVTYTVADSCGAASCRLTVTSDEGGGRTPDWAIVDDHHVRLRASRAGSGDGRVYSIAVSCADAADGTTTRTVQAIVPKSQSRR